MDLNIIKAIIFSYVVSNNEEEVLESANKGYVAETMHKLKALSHLKEEYPYFGIEEFEQKAINTAYSTHSLNLAHKYENKYPEIVSVHLSDARSWIDKNGTRERIWFEAKNLPFTIKCYLK